MSGAKIFIYLCLTFILGVFIFSFFVSPQKELVSQFYNSQVNLKGKIINQVEQRIDQQKFEFKTENIPGKILISAELYPKYFYGDKLKISGKLLEPSIFKDFNYKEYLAKDKIYLVSYYPEIKILERNQGNWLYQKIFNFKDNLREIIKKNMLPPESAILRAVFLGDKYGLSDKFKEKLNLTGTRHIMAISGMHILIWSQLILYLALFFGLWRKQAFYLVVLILFFYILMIGAPASAVRAGIMAGILLLAQYFGRLNSSGRTIVLAATIMLLINPWLLNYDVGFQLSFTAALSIIYLKPILDDKILGSVNSFLKDILTMSLAAQIGVLGLLVYHFGQFSLISPLANFLIVPFLPIIIILGIIFVLAGLIWSGLAKILVIPLWFLLKYIVSLIYFLSDFEFSFFEIKDFPLILLIFYYFLLCSYVFKKYKKKKIYS